MKFPTGSLLILGLLVCTAASPARALPESEATAGRLVARRYAEAVVGVKGSMYMNFTIGLQTLPPTERKFDVGGTVIEASGLTMTSLSSLDPRAVFESMRSQMKTGIEPIELGKSEYKNLRLRLADGAEIPAKIVWKDVDHDLALLIPTGAAASNRPFIFVDLNQATLSASVLGNYYQLSRTGEEFQRALMVRPSTVLGIIERPRRLFLVSTDIFPDGLGCPVFDPEGRVLGISLHYMEKGLPKDAVVVPASELASLIAQASPN
jgi:hypothetical protein